MFSLIALLAAGSLGVSSQDGSDHRRLAPGFVETRPSERRGDPSPNGLTTQVLGGCQERVQDGSFELGTSTPFWAQASTNFGTPLCTTAACGTGGGTAFPHFGDWWAWFGGIGLFEAGTLSQNVTLPVGTARLRFQFWIGARSGNGADFIRVRVAGTPVFQYFESMPGFDTYTLREVDISHFATGGTVQLQFESNTFGPGITNFSVDDVSIQSCPPPSLSISDVGNINEGDTLPNPASFSVTLSHPVAQPVTVSWATGNAPSGVQATPGADYAPGAGVLTFAPGNVVQFLGVTVTGDLLDEFNERFAVHLFSPAGALLGDPMGEVTIVDDDPLPTLSVSDATLVEGQAGTTAGLFTVALTPVSGRAVSGTYATANGSAQAGSDYTATSAGFLVPAGATSTVVTVPVLGDVVDEVDETFTTTLSAPDFAVLGDDQALATIDDDDGPSVAVGDASTTEGNAGTTPASFTVSLSGPSVQTVTLDYATAGGTAAPPGDFTAASGSVTFVPGSTSTDVFVSVIGDLADEPNEYFNLVLSNTVDAQPLDAEAQGVIVDDDGGTFALAGELTHGADSWRSLGPSSDLFVLPRPGRSSFEVLVDAASGDLGTSGPDLRRLAPDLSIVLQNSTPVGSGPARRLSVRNDLATPEVDYIEVASAGCSSDCGADDVYRIRVRETTLAAPRFNNAGGQVTVVLLQNPTDRVVSGTLWFWSPSGGLLADSPFILGSRQSLALNSAGIAALAGRSGSITATHDAPYAALVGKTVAVEPATGLGFDTPFEVRRR